MVSGGLGGSLRFESSDRGSTTETAGANLNIVNYDVRSAIRAAENTASRATNPEKAFSDALSQQILGSDGLRTKACGH
jgi:conjugal transfer mating pair stabilization protein TraG